MSKLNRIVEIGIIYLIVVMFSCGQSETENVQLSEFEKAEQEFRDKRDKSMRSETSWLTIAGLFWLDEGEYSFGTSEKNKIQLPKDSAPDIVGKFVFNQNKVTVVAAKKAGLKYKEKVVEKMVLKSDAEGRADILELKDLRMWVIKRGDSYAIRLRDYNAQAYKKYEGLDYFKPNEKYKIESEFVAYDSPKTVKVGTVVGTPEEYKCPGYVKFQIDGKEYQLDVFETSNAKRFYFIFKDETNGHETYGASRFLYANILEDGNVDMNFNRATNPPCAYTPYATCPLPPPQNYLSVRIEAGEKMYGDGH
jgi:uncharacterized protein (DUF1684 family)